MIKEIRFFFQKLFRGYNDRDLWNLDDIISKFLVPRLKGLRDNHMTFPSPPLKSDREWIKVLNKMIKAFEILSKEIKFLSKKEEKQVEEGLDLFRQYYRYLWD